jgi:hypothetical protein
MPKMIALWICARMTPSTCTAQAPQSAMPQPNFVPVMPSTSRNTRAVELEIGIVDELYQAFDPLPINKRRSGGINLTGSENLLAKPVISLPSKAKLQCASR